jgi:hypothetical protein
MAEGEIHATVPKARDNRAGVGDGVIDAARFNAILRLSVPRWDHQASFCGHGFA